MSTVPEIESAIQRLPREQMREIHEWLENLLEDQLAFKEEFQEKIERSEREMSQGQQPRVRKP